MITKFNSFSLPIFFLTLTAWGPAYAIDCHAYMIADLEFHDVLNKYKVSYQRLVDKWGQYRQLVVSEPSRPLDKEFHDALNEYIADYIRAYSSGKDVSENHTAHLLEAAIDYREYCPSAERTLWDVIIRLFVNDQVELPKPYAAKYMDARESARKIKAGEPERRRRIEEHRKKQAEWEREEKRNRKLEEQKRNRKLEAFSRDVGERDRRNMIAFEREKELRTNFERRKQKAISDGDYKRYEELDKEYRRELRRVRGVE